MAAPTAVFVESNSMTTTTLDWTYSGANNVGVYRSTNSVDYTLVATVTATTKTYTDTGLAAGTRYWYKLSDDIGVTFSSVVNVTTHVCLSSPDGAPQVLPSLTDEEYNRRELQDILYKIEEGFRGELPKDRENCQVCVTNGAIVLDCSSGCVDFTVEVTEDINSITINWCEEKDGQGDRNISFTVPPNTTRQICGWPAGMGFSGKECRDGPVNGGPQGRTVPVCFSEGKAGCGNSKNGYGPGSGSSGGGGGGGTGCNCVPGQLNQLTIKCCNGNCSLDCDGAKSLRLIACGGQPPYTWSNTGAIILSSTTGSSTTVTPPANTGSGVAGVAYHIYADADQGGHTSGTNHACIQTELFRGCNDNSIGGSSVSPCSTPTYGYAIGINTSCSGHVGHDTGCGIGRQATVICDNLYSTTETQFALDKGIVCDTRTAQMITDGCIPCGLEEGSTVTVTDNVGTAVSITIKV